jgi:outer membrane receptor for ferrienterochelin and colicins
MPKRFALSLLALAAASLAGAQQLQSTADAPARPAATVEVKASLDMVRQNDTASRTVIGHDELIKYGDQSVLDGYTQILVNGERMPAGFLLEALSPDAIEKVEVIRAATAEYSLDAIAGTINIVLRQKIGNKGGKNAGELKLSGGGGPGSSAQGLTLGKSGKQEVFG